MDEPSTSLDRRTIDRMRRLSSEERLALGLGLTATAIELAQSGGRTIRRPIRPRLS